MKNKRMAFDSLATLVMLLTGLVVCLVGCRQEADTKEASKLTADTKDREIEESLKRFETWQSFNEATARIPFFDGILSQKINRVKDPVQRMKFFRRLSGAAFGVPLDASDVAVRRNQFVAFCEMTRCAAGCAETYDDLDSYWHIVFRRIKVFQDEMKKIEAFLGGKGDAETFKGNRNDWERYYTYVKNVCERYCEKRAYYFGDMRTAYRLDYDRWQSIRARLEELVGHEVKVWRSVLEYWEEKRGKKTVSGTDAPVAARTKLPYRRYERLLRDVFFLDARGTAGAEKFGWRAERDVQGRTNIIGHDVEIRPAILKLWDEKRKKEQAAKSK